MTTKIRHLCAASALLLAAQGGWAASLFLDPAGTDTPVGDEAALTLMMDFASNEATIGGGVDIDLTGPLSFVSFVPSAYFTSAADPAFSGHGSTHADGDYEVHFGHFNGLSGRHALGVLTVRLEGVGQGHVNLSANSFWGGFYRADDGAAMAPSFAGAVVPVPEPASVAMLLAGLAAIGTAVRRRR